MTREEILEEVLSINSNNLLLELATGSGKSKLALELANKYIKDIPENERKILIVYPRNLLESNWRDEVIKWKMEYLLPYITFTSYDSLHKHAVDKEGNTINYSVCIFDECHHLSDLKRSIVKGYSSKYNVLLSATVNRNLKKELGSLFKGLHNYVLPVKTAIEEGILPDPTVILVPLYLKDIKESQEWVINPKAKSISSRQFPLNKSNYWLVKKQGCKDYQYILKGSVLDYNKLLNDLIDFYKSKANGSTVMRNIYVRMCGDRLKWLANIKTNVVLDILKVLKNYRTLTFCTSIEQANALGKYAIHSKNKKSTEIKDKFNEGKIKHITAVDCLTEGANLADCKFGIWARYNTSETKIPQKLGRILRHKKPYMILPFFRGTVEEDIVKTMIATLNAQNIVVVNSINEIKDKIVD